jgi:hypothetical protein
LLLDLTGGLSVCSLRENVFAVLEKVHAADKYRKRFGRAHKFWGDGSISLFVALQRVDNTMGMYRTNYLKAQFDILSCVIEWQSKMKTYNRVNCQED